jgi:hypothetical protein
MVFVHVCTLSLPGFGRSIRKSSEGGGLSRSKKSREEKERERLEKAREREIQKVEREQVSLSLFLIDGTFA